MEGLRVGKDHQGDVNLGKVGEGEQIREGLLRMKSGCG